MLLFYALDFFDPEAYGNLASKPVPPALES